MNNIHQNNNRELTVAARKNMGQWLGALEAKDLQKIINMYAEEAAFFPTIVDDLKRGRKGAEEYFSYFLNKNPKGHIIEELINEVGEGAYFHCGMYDFELDCVKTEGRATVKARFGFLWKKADSGKWEIFYHHSSLRPEQ